jgi:hypothetical protein
MGKISDGMWRSQDAAGVGTPTAWVPSWFDFGSAAPQAWSMTKPISSRRQAVGSLWLCVATSSVLATVWLASAPASAALTLNYVRTQAGAKSDLRMTFDEHHIRMDGVHEGPAAGPHGGPGAGHGPRANAVIVDAAGRKMIMLNPDKRTYHEITEADLQQMKARLETARAQMQERMKNAPPEQRKMMEQMMGGNAAAMTTGELPPVRYDALGQKKTVAGYPCEMYKVTIGEIAKSNSCFSPWSSGLVTKAEVEKFKALALEMKKMTSALGPSADHDWTKVPGIPIEETHFAADGKTVLWTSTLKSVERGAVPASTFAPPADYTKEELPMGPGMGGPAGRRGHGRPPAP